VRGGGGGGGGAAARGPWVSKNALAAGPNAASVASSPARIITYTTLARFGTVFPVSVVVGATVPAAVCRWGLCSCCPGVGRCLSGVY